MGGLQNCWVADLFEDLNNAGVTIIFVDTLGRDFRAVREELDQTLRLIQRHAGQHRLDLSRFAIAGCGSGGHFAALLGTDPGQLERAGLSFGALRGVVTLRSVGIDLERYVTKLRGDERNETTQRGLRYFGEDMAPLRSGSPTAHLAASNAPAFLFVEPVQPADTALSQLESELSATPATAVQRRVLPAAGERQHWLARERTDRQSAETMRVFLVARLQGGGRNPGR